MPDTMIFDLIANDEALLAALSAHADHVQVITTWVQEKQIAAVKNETHRAKLQVIPRTEVGVGVFVLGRARLGIDRLGREEPFESVRGEAKTSAHVYDALIAASADLDDLYLVTHDQRLMKRATAANVPTLNFAAFKKLVSESIAVAGTAPGAVSGQ
jgi:predicted nucleic acid-binding protein